MTTRTAHPLPGERLGADQYLVTLETGDTVLLYTDELIENVAENIGSGITRLIDSIKRLVLVRRRHRQGVSRDGVSDLCGVVPTAHLRPKSAVDRQQVALRG
jgi:hypothetical protein